MWNNAAEHYKSNSKDNIRAVPGCRGKDNEDKTVPIWGHRPHGSQFGRLRSFAAASMEDAGAPHWGFASTLPDIYRRTAVGCQLESPMSPSLLAT